LARVEDILAADKAEHVETDKDRELKELLREFQERMDARERK